MSVEDVVAACVEVDEIKELVATVWMLIIDNRDSAELD